MLIRRASSREMLSLWSEPAANARFFCKNIDSDNCEFWTIEDNAQLVGELYIFKRVSDPDFADGTNRAYLCAFRIAEPLRGQGLGTALMNRVLERVGELGFSEVTIGVAESEVANVRLYKRLGFKFLVKTCTLDPCQVDDNGDPVPEEFVLLRKDLA